MLYEQDKCDKKIIEAERGGRGGKNMLIDNIMLILHYREKDR